MLVSVVIPTYNRAKTIGRAVNSVLNQTWKQVDVIVVDDGSTDETDSILKSYGAKIRSLRQKNGGPSAARNAGIQVAKGEIIAFLDSDDVWLPTKIERQVDLLRRTESSGVVCCIANARMLFSSGAVTSFNVTGLKPKQKEGIWFNPTQILLDRFLLFNQVVAIRREALLKAGMFREDLPFGLNDDYDLSLRLSLLGPWAFIAEPLVEWYEHADNISRKHRQLEICTHTLRILEDIDNSSPFRAMLPRKVLNRRKRSLKSSIVALRLKGGRNPIKRAVGHLLHYYLRMHTRMTPPVHMLTNDA